MKPITLVSAFFMGLRGVLPLLFLCQPLLFRLEPSRMVRKLLSLRLGLVPVQGPVGLVLERTQGLIPELCSLPVSLRNEYFVHHLGTGRERAGPGLNLLAHARLDP